MRALDCLLTGIPGFPGYVATSDGHICGIRVRELSESISAFGYKRTALRVNGVRSTQQVHRMIAKAFVSNPDNKPEVNHKNGVKTDNRAENLEWCTRKENMRHAFDTGLHRGGSFGKFGVDHHRSRAIAGTNVITGERLLFPSLTAAAEYVGGDRGRISLCALNHKGVGYGYTWEYTV